MIDPENVVSRLGALLEQLPEFTEGDAYAAMESAGIPGPQADRAYKFTQIVCGRALLSGLGVILSDRYFCLNAAGEIVESGELTSEPFFAAASSFLARNSWSRWMGRLAAMSADVASVNDLLKRGSKPEGLVTSPPILFLERPTPAGMAAADRLSLSQLQASRPPRRKPWWQFWSP